MKRSSGYLWFLLALFLLPALTAPVRARAEDVFDFMPLADGSGAVLTKYNGKDAAVVIPGTLGGLPVLQIGDKAFQKCDFIQSVQFPEGLKAIGEYAFHGCKALQDPVLPDSLEVLGKWAFAGCFTLKGIRFPANVSMIGDAPVTACTSLEQIEVDPLNPFFASVDGALYSKDLRTLLAYPPGRTEAHVSLPQAVENIAARAFAGCRNLEEVSFPAGLKTIGPTAFYTCENLREAPLPEGLVSVGAGAFYWCSGLREMTLPATLVEVGPMAFIDLAGLTAFEVAPGNPVFSAPDGALYNTRDRQFVAWPPASPVTQYTIEGGTLSIAPSAFTNCTTLTGVFLPDGLLDIGADAFRNCSGIKTIAVPPSVTAIGDGAFTVWEGEIALEVRDPSAALLYAQQNSLPYDIIP